jgi:SAM-dependent methyltransferase
MLDNLVNRHDVGRLARRVWRRDVPDLLDRVIGSDRARVRRKWNEIEAEPGQWWVVGEVRRRWAEMVSGDPDVDFREYVAGKYLRDRRGLIGCSPGCGTGEREMAWAATGRFERFDAFDLSPVRIDVARAEAERRGLDHVLRFEVADVTDAPFDGGGYDVIVAEHSLHHFSPLHAVLRVLEDALRPDGFFFVDEYVGPTRFQWTARQLDAANGLLAALPERYRRTSTGIKRREIRPSKLAMYLDDPSEAVESAEIMPQLHARFDVVEVRGYGGAVLHLALANISRNFVSTDAETLRLLHTCFDIEDALLESGEIDHDFMIAVCRLRCARPRDE